MPHRDQSAIIVDRGTSPMAIVAGITFALAVLMILWMVFFSGTGSDNAIVDAGVPEVSVDVAPDGQ